MDTKIAIHSNKIYYYVIISLFTLFYARSVGAEVLPKNIKNIDNKKGIAIICTMDNKLGYPNFTSSDGVNEGAILFHTSSKESTGVIPKLLGATIPVKCFYIYADPGVYFMTIWSYYSLAKSGPFTIKPGDLLNLGAIVGVVGGPGQPSTFATTEDDAALTIFRKYYPEVYEAFTTGGNR